MGPSRTLIQQEADVVVVDLAVEDVHVGLVANSKMAARHAARVERRRGQPEPQPHERVHEVAAAA